MRDTGFDPHLSQKRLPLLINEKNFTFSIYPNPAYTQLYVKTEGSDNVISIYNLQGVVVKQVYLQTTLATISISDLSSALFIIEVSSNKGKSYQKLLVR